MLSRIASLPTGRTLRERKRDRTRRALLDAAVDLFERHGYDGTTVADIAATADIGTRTFFSYFTSKEELLFPDSDARVEAALAAIEARGAHDQPADVLLRALHDVSLADNGLDGMMDRVTALRLRFIQTVPAVRGRALRRQLDAQHQIAGHLRQAFPDQLDDVSAAALVGAFIGAVDAALHVLLEDPTTLDDPDRTRQQLRHAVEMALFRSAPDPV